MLEEKGRSLGTDGAAAGGGTAEIVRLMPSAPRMSRMGVVRVTLIAWAVGGVVYLVFIRLTGPFAAEFSRVLRGMMWFLTTLPAGLYILRWIFRRLLLRGWEHLKVSFEEYYPKTTDDPRSRMLMEQWIYGRKPDYRKMAEALERFPRPAGAARIVCLGLSNLTQVEQQFEEPLILRHDPYGTIPISACYLGIGIICGFVCMVRMKRVIAVLYAIWIGFFGSVLLYKLLIRPAFIRVAPGVVQFLRYGFFSGKPRLQEWRFDENAIVFLDHEPRFVRKKRQPVRRDAKHREERRSLSGGAPVSLVVKDGTIWRRFDLHFNNEEEWLKFVRFLLFRDSCPPLSGEELVG